MAARYPRSIVWLRRDLRLADNVALGVAAERSDEVVLAFNIDHELLASDRIGAPIVHAFFSALRALRDELRARGSDLALTQGRFEETLPALARRLDARAVFYNLDYEPHARDRDARVERALRAAGVDVHASLDHVYFGAGEVLTDAGEPYRVYTPYARRWFARFAASPRPPVDSQHAIEGRLLVRDAIGETRPSPLAAEFGFDASPQYANASESIARDRLAQFVQPGGAGERYAERRDLPGIDGTAQLSTQLRAGTIGIRACVHAAAQAAHERGGNAQRGLEKWIAELVWREFYQMILWHFPAVDGAPFVRAAERLQWSDDHAAFAAWCEARTGYPIVDAAMVQLNTTGWMHNRLRMIVASFLTKDLLIDWRWGERYFEQRLADADLAQNNGGWQWAASTGTDAAPYFRVFNPVLQSKKFDPDGRFIRAMLPALARVPDAYVHEPSTMPPLLQREAGCEIGRDYPLPIVDHHWARERALALYAPVLGKAARAGISS